MHPPPRSAPDPYPKSISSESFCRHSYSCTSQNALNLFFILLSISPVKLYILFQPTYIQYWQKC